MTRAMLDYAESDGRPDAEHEQPSRARVKASSSGGILALGLLLIGVPLAIDIAVLPVTLVHDAIVLPDWSGESRPASAYRAARTRFGLDRQSRSVE